jgi:predicted acetyltransferase
MQARNEPVAALWASEETIYGRFGFGLASLNLLLTADRRAGMRAGLPAREGGIRLVEQDEALRTLPRLYERVRRTTPGFLSRSRDWWELRLLDDRPERRRGAGPLNRAVLELDGRPSGYALYRIAQKGSGLDWSKTVRVVEAVGVDARATREIWRFLFEIDWTDSVEYWHLPVDHPLRLLAGRVNLLRATVADALWVRLVDLPAALAARTYAREGTVTVEVVSDPLVPANVGIWSVGEGAARRSRRRPDVRLSVQALGSVYLGGFSLRELAAAELVEEGTRGGLAKADELFRTQAAPWCPEIF